MSVVHYIFFSSILFYSTFIKLDDGKYACDIFFDFQKAHCQLQICWNKQKKFKCTSINYGVPQGSDLGPLLFLIYINDLNGAVTHWKVHYFADDTNVICQQFFERQKQKGQL